VLKLVIGRKIMVGSSSSFLEFVSQ